MSVASAALSNCGQHTVTQTSNSRTGMVSHFTGSGFGAARQFPGCCDRFSAPSRTPFMPVVLAPPKLSSPAPHHNCFSCRGGVTAAAGGLATFCPI
jgi:hypothetical protein